MVGDKPVDARVARGLPPLRREAPGGRSLLSFGFYNTLGEPSKIPSSLDEYRVTFDILAASGDACSFAPLAVLLRALLPQSHSDI